MGKSRIIGLALILSLAVLADAQQFRYMQVKRDIIEARLISAPPKNKDRRARLEAMFQESGCKDDHLAAQKVSGSSLPNVICTLPGQTDVEIIVGAHYDNQGAGSGIVDNWSGAALLPSLYESLSSEPRKHTFRFIGFTDEEKGLIGSAFYVKALTKDDLPKLHAMINLDTLGLSPASLWFSHADKTLAEDFYAVARSMEMPRLAVDVDKVGSTDSESFRNRKIASLTIHSLTQETFPILHTPKDKLSAIHLDDYYQTYRLVSAYLTYVDR
jgi:Zn-dependent M28 family amino/carboxypeptidase